jgi:hypothetical protein
LLNRIRTRSINPHRVSSCAGNTTKKLKKKPLMVSRVLPTSSDIAAENPLFLHKEVSAQFG